MASGKNVSNLTIRQLPWRGSLATAGQKATVPEDALWRALEVSTDLDGMYVMRPGRRKWGSDLQTPDPDATGSSVTNFTDFLTENFGMVKVDASNNLISTTRREGILTTSVRAGTTSDTYDVYRPDSPTGNEWSLRFQFRGTNLPAYTPAGTVANTFALRGIAGAGTGKQFAIWSGGVYYQNAADDEYTLVAGSANAAAGGWNMIEVRVDDNAGNTTVYLNDTLIDTISSALIKDVAPTSGAAFELGWICEGTGGSSTQYTTKISSVMYNDTITAPFKAVPIKAITDFRYITKAGSARAALLIAAGNYIWHDNDLGNAWHPLHPKKYSDVFFAPYRRTMIWCDNNGAKFSSTWQWNGFDDPERLDDAPRIRFCSEHRQRLLAAGDRDNPLRLYYSGDRKPDRWFSPAPDNVEDQIEVALDAGYLEIPAKKGDEITAIHGDYYGSAIICTRHGAWRLDGAGFRSYELNAISLDIGCENANCIEQVGNDLYLLSRQGVHSLIATQKYGNIESSYVSKGIQDIWGKDPSSVDTISREYLDQARLTYNPQQGLVYVAVPMTGDVAAEKVYVYNINTQQWTGPWAVDSRALQNVEIGTPALEVVMHAGLDGQVGYTDLSRKKDFGTTSYTLRIESAQLDGRSLDPKLVGMQKRFRRLRIYLLPRGNWDVTVNWWTDGSEKRTRTLSQNVYRAHTLTEEFRLTINPDALLRSREEQGYIEVFPDMRGQFLTFQIESDYDIAVQGFELDIAVSGYERES